MLQVSSNPVPDRTGAHVVGASVSAGRLVKRFVIFAAHIGTNRKLAVSLEMHFPQGGGRITMRMGALSATLLVVLAAIGCVPRDGRNSDCKWPTEIVSHAPGARHLSADAEFAEDLAIRYADTHHGLHTPYYVSGDAYAGARDRCMGALFEQIAKEHGVPLGQVSDSLGRNRAHIDLAVILPFVLLYCLAAPVVARAIWRRYPPIEHGWIPGVTMVLFLSLVFAVGSTMLGEVWSGIAESFRIGNGHMSYRTQRLLWGRHRTEMFSGALIVFWLAATQVAHHMRSNHSLPFGRSL